MELFKKIRALFQRELPVAPPASLCTDEEFLAFVAAPVRKRIEEERAAATTPETRPQQAA